MTVRMDSGIKAAFDALCAQFGMSANAAMNIFANAVVMQRRIPFTIGIATPEREDEALRLFHELRAQAASSNTPEMTLEEINEEIRLAREEMDRKRAAL